MPGNAAAILSSSAADVAWRLQPGAFGLFASPQRGSTRTRGRLRAFHADDAGQPAETDGWAASSCACAAASSRLRPTRLLAGDPAGHAGRGLYAQAPRHGDGLAAGACSACWAGGDAQAGHLAPAAGDRLPARARGSRKTARQAFSVTGSDPFFPVSSWTAGLMTVGGRPCRCPTQPGEIILTRSLVFLGVKGGPAIRPGSSMPTSMLVEGRRIDDPGRRGSRRHARCLRRGRSLTEHRPDRESRICIRTITDRAWPASFTPPGRLG